jgi:hypothetical protein
MRFCLVDDASDAEIGQEIGIVSCGDAYAIAMFNPGSARKLVRVPVAAPPKDDPRYATPGMFGLVTKVTPMPEANPAITRVDFVRG